MVYIWWVVSFKMKQKIRISLLVVLVSSTLLGCGSKRYNYQVEFNEMLKKHVFFRSNWNAQRINNLEKDSLKFQIAFDSGYAAIIMDSTIVRIMKCDYYMSNSELNISIPMAYNGDQMDASQNYWNAHEFIFKYHFDIFDLKESEHISKNGFSLGNYKRASFSEVSTNKVILTVPVGGNVSTYSYKFKLIRVKEKISVKAKTQKERIRKVFKMLDVK